MKIEICIPAFNEAPVIAAAAREVLDALRRAGREALVTVSDNASTDGTADAAKKIEGVSVLPVPIRGKGAAVVAAARHSDADFFGYIDADLSADPSDIIPLLSIVETNVCDIAIGSRLADVTKVERGVLRTLSSQALNMWRRVVVGIDVKDTQCGLKIMNVRGRKILKECVETGWFFDIEFLARAERAGLRIKEVPIHWNEHRFPERASKLKLITDGVGYLRAIFRIKKLITAKYGKRSF